MYSILKNNKFHPSLTEAIHQNKAKEVKLRFNEQNHPLLFELCQSIEYNNDNYLDSVYQVFSKEFWNHETPLFIYEQRKVLDVLQSSSVSRETHENNVIAVYRQECRLLNDPPLSTMCHGPEIMNKVVYKEDIFCNIKADQIRSNSHDKGWNTSDKDYKPKDNWTFHHTADYSTMIQLM